jgi:ABC-2 type transport system permease protein
MFPLRNMPAWLRAISYALPARFYIAVLRGTLQKGVGLAEQAAPLAALAVYAAVIGMTGVIAIRRLLR